MTGEIEAAGEFATGALIGRAVEPRAGEGHGGGHLCLNCGTALVGAHCHRCGQTGHVHRSLGAIGHEILHGVAHFEGKLWRTLPLLTWRPGELTRRYVEGERARFVSPMAIFLFSIFAMFAVFSWAGISTPSDIDTGSMKPVAALDYARKDAQKKLEEAKADLAKADNAEDRAKYREDVTDSQNALKGIDQAANAIGTGNVKGQSKWTRTGWHVLDHGIEKWQKNPSLMLYKLQSSVYKFSWLLIPLSLPFMWLLFAWRREYRLYDHTVFVTYSIAFMSLLLIVLTVAGAIGVSAGWISTAALTVPLIHIVRQMKQAYALGWTSAIIRSLVLSFFILIVVILFLLILVALGMSG